MIVTQSTLDCIIKYINSMPSCFASLLFFTVVLMGCSTYSGKSFLPDLHDYNTKHKEVFVLKKRLLEISGLVYLGNDSVAAVNDEKGELFLLDLKTNSSEKYKFGGKGDYEDLVKVDTNYYALISNGDIVKVSAPPQTSGEVYTFPENHKKIEFESLVWYKHLRKLVLISKDQRARVDGITAYTFDPATKQFDTTPFFNIPIKDILIKASSYSADCKPSGAAIHPVTGKLFIIASIGKMMLICTPEGKLEKLFKLNPAQFPQPEGIAFANNGDMYISNEGLDGKATILKFPYSGRK
ncbi:MAG: SdiA-regulated domain-containing protein, partial [Chitinophagaceae bacterium]|nr:SdiA-regulated domain-containing protein [Chitinophagaceae bacterium]